MIRDRNRLATTDARETALECVEAGIDAARPERVVRESVSVDGDVLVVDDARYDLTPYDEVVILGGGKPAAHVAAAMESILDGVRPVSGVVVTDDPTPTTSVTVLEASHPVPDERGVAAARRVLDAARAADGRTLVVAVVGGGGSALLPAPAADLSLADLQSVTAALLDAGADIEAINAVRKHCSALKGGQLARACGPATVVSLVFSDVVGDDLSVVASGPTAPDATTYEDALAVLDRYAIDVPAVRAHLDRGAAGDRPETPSPDDPAFDRVAHHVLASNRTAVDAARAAARERGYETLVLSTRVRGEAEEAAKTHAAIAEEAEATGDPVAPPAVVLSGGECTVTVTGDGTGGPNQAFALSLATECEADAWTFAAVDTDGRDGGTDAAGALVDRTTVDDVGAARTALDGDDAYPFLDARDALVRTGRTGTNVNDLRVLVLG